MTDSENPRRSGAILGTGDAYPTAGDPGLVREDSATGDQFAPRDEFAPRDLFARREEREESTLGDRFARRGELAGTTSVPRRPAATGEPISPAAVPADKRGWGLHTTGPEAGSASSGWDARPAAAADHHTAEFPAEPEAFEVPPDALARHVAAGPGIAAEPVSPARPGPYPPLTMAQPGYYPSAHGPAGPPPGDPAGPGGPRSPFGPGAGGRSGSGRFGRRTMIAALVAAVALGSGVTGGLIGAGFGDHPATVANTSGSASTPITNGGTLADVAARVQPSVVSIKTGNAEGSGVVMTADGQILTNNHVVDGSNGDLTVTFSNGKSARAKVVGTDPRSDLAVIQAQSVSGLTAAKFGDSDGTRVGDTVLALGSPLGLEGSVTAGIISAKNRTISVGGDQNQRGGGGSQSISGMLQTDAPINPGNSGGALVNTNGEVIGINSAIATSGSGNGNIGVGFAIPSKKATAVAQQLAKGSKVSHAYLGVSLGEAQGNGAVIGQITPNSPAAKAGLAAGDVITKFGDAAVNSSDELVNAVQQRNPGDKVQVTYRRDGQDRTVTVTLADSPS